MAENTGNRLPSFIYLFEEERRWYTYSIDETAEINRAIELNKSTLKLKEATEEESEINLMKMLEVKSGNERRIRCIFYNSGFYFWRSIDEDGMGNCLNPAVTFELEKSFHNNTENKIFNDGLHDYVFDLTNLTLTDCTMKETLSVKREPFNELTRSKEIKGFIAKNERFFSELPEDIDEIDAGEVHSFKRRKIDTGLDTGVISFCDRDEATAPEILAQDEFAQVHDNAPKLPESVRDLMELITDKTRIEEILIDFNYDSNKSPLEKLTKERVLEGFVALRRISDYISSGKKMNADLMDLSHHYYVKIPHNIGMIKTSPYIRTAEEVNQEVKLLEVLLNITVAMEIFKSCSSSPTFNAESPSSHYYHSLAYSLEHIPPESELFLELRACLDGTSDSTQFIGNVEILNAFQCIKNETELERVKSLNSDDKLLLWYGCPVANCLGILKKGICCAPSEAPVQGYMFGKGIYFADVSSKSASKCFVKRMNYGILLLCEVSVGKQHLLQNAAEALPSGLPNDKDSVLGQGRIQPSEFKIGPLSPEAKVPCGPLQCDNSYDGSLHYNEYVVYSADQVKIKYLIQIKFAFK